MTQSRSKIIMSRDKISMTRYKGSDVTCYPLLSNLIHTDQLLGTLGIARAMDAFVDQTSGHF